jgi:hypothetical protein
LLHFTGYHGYKIMKHSMDGDMNKKRIQDDWYVMEREHFRALVQGRIMLK